MDSGKRMTAIGLTTSVLATMVGCPGALAEAAEPANAQSTDENYNILFITVDQEHYFSQYPTGTSLKARQLLAELGTSFENTTTAPTCPPPPAPSCSQDSMFPTTA